MNQRRTYYLALLAVLLCLLTLTPARAQVLKGTFAAGSTHSLAIHADGTLWATGSNLYGELGDGTTTERATWVQVGTATNWVQVAAGHFYSLGLRTDGSLWAWGENTIGQLGNSTNNGTYLPNPVPTQVPGTYSQVAVGWAHSLGLRADGSLWVWGDNRYGQLGNATGNGIYLPNPVPTQVTGTYVHVAAGVYYTLALRADGSLWAWGSNYHGELGTTSSVGLNTANPVPGQVPGTYTQVAAGAFHALGLRADGSLWAWGDNSLGALGIATNSGTTTANPVPTQVPGTYTSISAGYYHSLTLRADGSLWAWGSNQYGQLGSTTNSGTTAPNPVPTPVPGTYVRAMAGFQHSLALQASGQLLAWGWNLYGQLGSTAGYGTTAPNATPTATGTALPTRSTAANYTNGFAIKGDGTLWTWGSSLYGLLGDGTTTNRSRPSQVGAAHDWVQVVAGNAHAMALKANGTLWTWGNNNFNQASPTTATTILVPTQVGSYTFASIAAGGNFNLGRTATGQLYAWGTNDYAQLGTGSTAGSLPTPTAVSGGLTFASMAAGGEFALGLTATGQVYGWGYNLWGQTGISLSNLPTSKVEVPTLVAGVPALRQVSAGTSHSLVLTATGAAYSWGNNSLGQLGMLTNSGINAPNATPLAIAGLAPLRQLEATGSHSLGLTATGTIYSWGYNTWGTLAQGTFSTAASPVPTQEATLNTAWAQLGTGCAAFVSLVRTASGLSFASAGWNSYGQLGDGTTTDWPRFDRLSPLTSLQPLPVLAGAAGAAFALAPNPARTQATAVGLPAGSTLAVYDAVGRLVVASPGLSFSVAGLPAGLYVVRATVPGQAAQSARLVVE